MHVRVRPGMGFPIRVRLVSRPRSGSRRLLIAVPGTWRSGRIALRPRAISVKGLVYPWPTAARSRIVVGLLSSPSALGGFTTFLLPPLDFFGATESEGMGSDPRNGLLVLALASFVPPHSGMGALTYFRPDLIGSPLTRRGLSQREKGSRKGALL
jgi:hypothetical protein